MDAFCDAYTAQQPNAQLFESTQSQAIFVWDTVAGRVVLVYGLSVPSRPLTW